MSDPAGEPGAPSNGATKIPSASDKSVSKEVQTKLPKLAALLATPDKTLLRLNKLLASPGGLSAFLSTFNYTLYLLVYLEAKSVPLRARLYELLGRTEKPYTGPSHFQALGAMLSSARTTLRLFGLLPMYAWARQLLQGPKPGQDQVLYATAVTQCSLYMTFQFLENVAVLTDSQVLPTSYTARWTASNGGKTSKMYLWAYRAWCAGVACDFVRLFREAQLDKVKRSKRSPSEKTTAVKEDREADAKWRSQVLVPSSWMPVAVHFSTEGGQPWFNLGIMGACGAVAGLGRTAELWAATADA